ncbi:hypothetical protein ANO11243_016120 [Dothideomycetidae sp. 11243]|nr:hypothetical protein ANO11243_016120 [fungal sp. No.11243]
MLKNWCHALLGLAFFSSVEALPAGVPLSVDGTNVVASANLASSSMPSVFRGVNIGNWLVLEKWMDSTNLFSGAFSGAVDQWTFDSIPGAQEALELHWSTWFNETDVEKIASWGFNALRIPIGYWAYSSKVQAPYLKGADAYLAKAIGWCRTHGLKVLIDLHGVPGSQNGWDNSGHTGNVEWQSNNNMFHTTQALRQITRRYTNAENADVVFGIELVNEPISWGNNNFQTTQSWTQRAFKAVQAVSKNSNLNVIMHDSFTGANSWTGVGQNLNGNSALAQSRFWIDEHLYQNQVAADSTLNQKQHIQKACGWASTELLPSSSNLPVIVGEFSAATNVCVNPDHTSTAGTSCTTTGCQCSASTDMKEWKLPLKQATRRFFEAQVQTFEAHGRGWFIWAYKAPGAWGLTNLMEYGILGSSVTDYKYPNICS